MTELKSRQGRPFCTQKDSTAEPQSLNLSGDKFNHVWIPSLYGQWTNECCPKWNKDSLNTAPPGTAPINESSITKEVYLEEGILHNIGMRFNSLALGKRNKQFFSASDDYVQLFMTQWCNSKFGPQNRTKSHSTLRVKGIFMIKVLLPEDSQSLLHAITLYVLYHTYITLFSL